MFLGLCVQVRVDGQLMFEEDLRFELLQKRLRMVVPNGGLSRHELISQARMTRHARSISDSSCVSDSAA